MKIQFLTIYYPFFSDKWCGKFNYPFFTTSDHDIMLLKERRNDFD